MAGACLAESRGCVSSRFQQCRLRAGKARCQASQARLPVARTQTTAGGTGCSPEPHQASLVGGSEARRENITQIKEQLRENLNLALQIQTAAPQSSRCAPSRPGTGQAQTLAASCQGRRRKGATPAQYWHNSTSPHAGTGRGNVRCKAARGVPAAIGKAKPLQPAQRRAQNCWWFVRLCLRGFLPLFTTNKAQFRACSAERGRGGLPRGICKCTETIQRRFQNPPAILPRKSP